MLLPLGVHCGLNSLEVQWKSQTQELLGQRHHLKDHLRLLPTVGHLSLDVPECSLHLYDWHSKLRTFKALASLILLFEVANLCVLCLEILAILWLACGLDGRALA